MDGQKHYEILQIISKVVIYFRDGDGELAFQFILSMYHKNTLLSVC